MDGASFLAYVEQMTLQPGDMVIADNLAAHTVDTLERPARRCASCRPTVPTSTPSS